MHAFQLARALARSGALEEALVEMKETLATGVRDARAYELAATLERQAGVQKRAEIYDQLADELDPLNGAWRSFGLTPR